MIVPSIGWALLLVNLGQMELICSHTEAAHNSLDLSRLELYSSFRGPA